MAGLERKWLTESLEALLVTEFERRGFRKVPLTPEEARSEIQIAFPFGRLRREGPAGLEIVEIQLDKRRAPAFRLNLGVAPPDGTEHPLSGHIDQDHVWVHYLDRGYEMYDGKLLRRWFAVRGRPGRAPTKPDYEALVGKVVARIPEIEALFREGERGHFREVKLT